MGEDSGMQRRLARVERVPETASRSRGVVELLGGRGYVECHKGVEVVGVRRDHRLKRVVVHLRWCDGQTNPESAISVGGDYSLTSSPAGDVSATQVSRLGFGRWR